MAMEPEQIDAMNPYQTGNLPLLQPDPQHQTGNLPLLQPDPQHQTDNLPLLLPDPQHQTGNHHQHLTDNHLHHQPDQVLARMAVEDALWGVAVVAGHMVVAEAEAVLWEVEAEEEDDDLAIYRRQDPG